MNKDLKERIRRRLITDYREILASDSIDPQQLESTIRYIWDELVRRENVVISAEEKAKIPTDLIH